jgi:hypothetical protein
VTRSGAAVRHDGRDMRFEHRRVRFAPRLLLALGAFAGAAFGQGGTLKAVAVDAGPLAFFSVPTPDPARGPDDRWFVVSAGSDAPAAPWWDVRGNAEPVRRLDATTILVASFGEPYGLVAVDLAQGRARTIAAGSPRGLVGVVGDEIVFHGDPRDGDARLYARPWKRDAEARRLTADAFGRILHADARRLFVLAGEEGTELRRIDLPSGAATKLTDLPKDRMASLATFALSPNGARFAVGGTNGTLRIHDAETGALVRERKGLAVAVSPVSSSIARLRVAWIDDATVRYSETRDVERLFEGGGRFWFVDWNVDRDATVAERDYAPVGLSYGDPAAPVEAPASRPARSVAGLFERETGRVHFAGEARAAADCRNSRGEEEWGDVVLSPDGAFALVRERIGGRVLTTLLDGRAKSKRVLHDGWTRNLGFLPAAPR